jgi:NAD(P)-dependent dehydrogenase (short-subunit alcohol dehydrogenase family)
MDLTGRVALITGAGSGLGAAIAHSFAQAGATLAVLDLENAPARATLEATRAKGTSVAADVSDERAVAEAAAAIERDVGPIDVVVNNAGVAGIGGPKRLHETPPGEWARVIAVNLSGPYLVCRSVLPSMIARQRGVIVNVASAAGLVAFAGRSPYVASKAALINLTRNLAVEYADYGIRANVLCPGWMDTPLIRWRLGDPGAAAKVTSMVPMGRVGTPEELAEAALFLASDSSRYMTGQALVVDGGWTAV